MDQKSMLYWGLGIIALVALTYVLLPGEGPREYDSFAQCVTNAGATMYGTDWCPHCKNQKALFGPSFDSINYVNCDARGDECLLAGVDRYPTWVVQGANYPGTQSLERLAALTGCDLVKDLE